MGRVSTYLNFPRNTEEAFNFYKSVFAKEFDYFSRFKEMPKADEPQKLSAEEGERVMHVSLPIGKETVL
jgi:PhnB protein